MDLNRPAPPLLSRILLAVSALLVVGVVYYFVSGALEEPPQPPPAPLRQAKGFDPRADISKNPSFPSLQESVLVLPDMPLGRPNPFLPLSGGKTASATTTAKTVSVPGTDIRVVPVSPAANQSTTTNYE